MNLRLQSRDFSTKHLKNYCYKGHCQGKPYYVMYVFKQKTCLIICIIYFGNIQFQQELSQVSISRRIVFFINTEPRNL